MGSDSPDLSSVTGVERRLWGRILDRQFRSDRSTYRKNYERYGHRGAVLLSTANLWIGLSFPFVAGVFIAGALSKPEIEVVAGCIAFVMLATGVIRLVQAVQEGKRFRSAS